MITVTVTDTGWKVVGEEPVTHGEFVAELPECTCLHPSKPTPQSVACTTGGTAGHHHVGYHQQHVEAFVKRVAATYKPKPTLPEVPARS